MRVTSYRQIAKVLRREEVASELFRIKRDMFPMGPDVYYLRPGDHGLMIFIRREPGVFEVHAAMLPEDQPVKPKIEAAFAWMVDNAGMTQAIGSIRESNRKARYMAVRVGMVPTARQGNMMIYRGDYGLHR